MHQGGDTRVPHQQPIGTWGFNAAAILYWLVLNSWVLAQSNQPVVQNLPAQPIGPNDLIAITVYGSPEMNRTIRVGNDGLIRLPMIQKRIKAQGLYPADLETSISQAIDEAHLLNDPFVTVTIAEYHSRPISVSGAVRHPLVFQATTPVPLLEAIARADGLLETAGSEVIVHRSRNESADSENPSLQRVSLEALLNSSDPSLNLILTGGEDVRVPEAQKIYVVGNVKKPGAFPVPRNGQTTVLQALALAEGLTPFYTKEAYIYREEGGSKRELPVDLGKILKRQMPDVPLEGQDIFYIPDNKNKHLTVAALDRVLSFGTATASGVLIWH